MGLVQEALERNNFFAINYVFANLGSMMKHLKKLVRFRDHARMGEMEICITK